MKSTNNLACILITISVFLTQQAAADDIYLIIGQSNAAGRDTNFDYDNLDAPDPNVRLFTDSNEITEAFQPLNDYSTIRRGQANQGVCFGLEFGKEMARHTGNPTLLVVNARGSSRISSWRRGEGHGYFEEAVERVRAAEEVTGDKLKGILWHQGESDVRNPDTAAYFDNLIELIEEFREELGDDVPFLCGQLYQKELNEVLNGVLRLIDNRSFFPLQNVDWVSSSHLTAPDRVHFDAESTREFGLRYADIMKGYIS